MYRCAARVRAGSQCASKARSRSPWPGWTCRCANGSAMRARSRLRRRLAHPVRERGPRPTGTRNARPDARRCVYVAAYIRTVWKRPTAPQPCTELDGTPLRDVFTVLAGSAAYTPDQYLHVFTMSALHSWLLRLHSDPAYVWRGDSSHRLRTGILITFPFAGCAPRPPLPVVHLAPQTPADGGRFS